MTDYTHFTGDDHAVLAGITLGELSKHLPARPVVDNFDDYQPVSVPSITCPRCGRTSYNRNDIANGYCGACHDWTSKAAGPQ